MLEVNAIDPLSPHRTADELRKKWNDLRHHTIKYRTRLAVTGGGPPPKKPTFYDEVMDVIEEKKTLLYGIPDTNDIPSLGWQEVVASSVIIPDPFEEDIAMEHVLLMASSPLAIEHAEEPQNAANAQDGQSKMANDLPHNEKENGPSPGPSKVCHTHRLTKRKQKSKKSVTGDEPWEEYLRGMISLNKGWQEVPPMGVGQVALSPVKQLYCAGGSNSTLFY
ncbi:hypothetical protein RRG08_058858 [Elysia crispata]|uniref:Uncharacterized protein n=1 Tax=Elysia crispata TaxID=231223 RepID=A0AAE1CQH4_9GAST|nr:hypothetical protein RRG08_058858 [Elysia crispata]